MDFLRQIGLSKRVPMPEPRVRKQDPDDVMQRHLGQHGNGASMDDKTAKEFGDAWEAHLAQLFVERIAKKGGKFSQVMPLLSGEHGEQIDIHKAHELMMSGDREYRKARGQTGGLSLLQYLDEAVPEREGPPTVDQLKKAAEYINNFYPDVHFNFFINTEDNTLTCTATINRNARALPNQS